MEAMLVVGALALGCRSSITQSRRSAKAPTTNAQVDPIQACPLQEQKWTISSPACYSFATRSWAPVWAARLLSVLIFRWTMNNAQAQDAQGYRQADYHDGLRQA